MMKLLIHQCVNILLFFCLLVNISFAAMSSEPISVIPDFFNGNDEELALGKKLFFDKRLSGDNTISCDTCHPLDRAGVDGLAQSVGSNGLIGDKNSPTVYNVVFQFRYFWDGRSASLEEQIDGPILNVHEMNSNWESIIKKLKADERYRKLFNVVFNDGITANNIRHAIAEFERSLITPNSRFDQYLNGDESALNHFEKQGYILFKRYGCSSCHQGKLVGGNMYEKMGAVKPYYGVVKDATEKDYGLFLRTGRLEDKFEFKVPSLRNIELTAPYFHDGSVKTLEEAIRLMGLYQTGRHLLNIEVERIIAFLKTLTGDFPQIDAPEQ